MKLTAACSSAVRAEVQAPDRPAEVLGCVASALYLRAGRSVLAVLTADAVRLPCALVLGTSRADLPLTSLRPRGPVTVGSGRLAWTSTDGPVAVAVAREWAPPRPRPVVPRPDLVASLSARVAALDCGVDASPLVVDDLLGRGPGLTPSGDDVLAGYLLAAGAFGVDARPVRAVVLSRASTATTALSARLLHHAVRGEGIAEVVDLVHALGGGELKQTLARLLQVGHTSGAALATGVALAAGDTLSLTQRAIA